jgi:hypothetical protein
MVEYCGNEISEEGLSMSAKKDPKVLTSLSLQRPANETVSRVT